MKHRPKVVLHLLGVLSVRVQLAVPVEEGHGLVRGEAKADLGEQKWARNRERGGKETDGHDAKVPVVALALEGPTYIGDGEREADEWVLRDHVVCSEEVV